MQNPYKNKKREIEMGSTTRSVASKPSSNSSKNRLLFINLLIIISLPLIFFIVSSTQKPKATTTPKRVQMESKNSSPYWFNIIAKEFKKGKKIKVGLVNIDDDCTSSTSSDGVCKLHGLANTETIKVKFDPTTMSAQNLTWKDFFPEWIDEERKWRTPKCPEMPMPERREDHRKLDAVVARAPCGTGSQEEGIRHLLRLQVNLVVANLAVESGWGPDVRKSVYVVFIGSCGPMVEIFRCDDLVVHRGDYWVYKPDMIRLKQKVLMPVGTCQIPPAYSLSGKEGWRYFSMFQNPKNNKGTADLLAFPSRPKYAYVTILHSSESYLCGAIALAQSLRLSRTTEDLVLLADSSISPNSTAALSASGWNVHRIHRVRSSFSKKGTYNEWNYTKLRIWQLLQYDKLIYMDSDLLVLRNIDHFFTYPQLSASANSRFLFNSGVMVVEPSACLFHHLMSKSLKLKSYNGGDQGFLNEYFTWWHRLPAKLNFLKHFERGKDHEIVPDDVFAVHYLGLKPWMCYRDYDCNWDLLHHHRFASDEAHRIWWMVYDTMPVELRSCCGLTTKMGEKLELLREKARDLGRDFPDEHWKIVIKDPRQFHYVD